LRVADQSILNLPSPKRFLLSSVSIILLLLNGWAWAGVSASNAIRRSDKKADAGVRNSIYALMPEQSAIQVLFLDAPKSFVGGAHCKGGSSLHHLNFHNSNYANFHPGDGTEWASDSSAIGNKLRRESNAYSYTRTCGIQEAVIEL
jgi:hypothetical protein